MFIGIVREHLYSCMTTSGEERDLRFQLGFTTNFQENHVPRATLSVIKLSCLNAISLLEYRNLAKNVHSRMVENVHLSKGKMIFELKQMSDEN